MRNTNVNNDEPEKVQPAASPEAATAPATPHPAPPTDPDSASPAVLTPDPSGGATATAAANPDPTAANDDPPPDEQAPEDTPPVDRPDPVEEPPPEPDSTGPAAPTADSGAVAAAAPSHSTDVKDDPEPDREHEPEATRLAVQLPLPAVTQAAGALETGTLTSRIGHPPVLADSAPLPAAAPVGDRLASADALIELGAADDRPQAVLVAEGPIRDMADGRGRYTFTARALQEATSGGRFNGLACFLDHGEGHPTMRDYVGIWDRAALKTLPDGRLAATARLTVHNPALVHHVFAALAEPEQRRPDIGVSIVCYPTLAGDGSGTITGFRSIQSADIVFKPAVPAARFFQAAAAAEATPIPSGEAEMDESPVTPDAAAVPPDSVDPAPVRHEMEQLQGWIAAARQQMAAQMIRDAKLPPRVTDRLLQGEYPSPEAVSAAIDAARDELTEVLSAQAVINTPKTAATVVSDEFSRAEEALRYIFGARDAKTPAANLRSLRQLWVAWTGDANILGQFNADDAIGIVKTAAVTPTALPNMMVRTIQAIMQDETGNLGARRWFEKVVDVVPNDGTMRDLEFKQFGNLGELPRMPDGAPYQETTISDSKETASFYKYGQMIGITRNAILQDDLGLTSELPRKLVQAAWNTRSAAVAAIFTMNAGVGPTMGDLLPLFHASHGNLATTALGATDADVQASWEAARQATYDQSELGTTKPMAIYPYWLLLPAELLYTARKAFGYGELGYPTSHEPLRGDFDEYDMRPRLLVVPEWTDATDWAFMVRPEIHRTVVMAYQHGGRTHPLPTIWFAADPSSGLLFTNDVLPIKVRDEFMVGVASWRGIGKRNVAN